MDAETDVLSALSSAVKKKNDLLVLRVSMVILVSPATKKHMQLKGEVDNDLQVIGDVSGVTS